MSEWLIVKLFCLCADIIVRWKITHSLRKWMIYENFNETVKNDLVHIFSELQLSTITRICHEESNKINSPIKEVEINQLQLTLFLTRSFYLYWFRSCFKSKKSKIKWPYLITAKISTFNLYLLIVRLFNKYGSEGDWTSVLGEVAFTDRNKYTVRRTANKCR